MSVCHVARQTPMESKQIRCLDILRIHEYKFLQITFIGCTILPYFLISSDNKSDQICFENCGPGRLRDFITVLSLSFHSIFEGLAVGLESTTGNVWKLFAGMKLDYSIGIRCYKFF